MLVWSNSSCHKWANRQDVARGPGAVAPGDVHDRRGHGDGCASGGRHSDGKAAREQAIVRASGKIANLAVKTQARLWGAVGVDEAREGGDEGEGEERLFYKVSGDEVSVKMVSRR